MEKRVLGIFAMMMLLVNGAFAQKPAVVMSDEQGWQRIGQVTASFKTTSESIVVMGADNFQAIKLKVKDAPINIERLQVFYESGDMEEIEVSSELKEGAETSVMNLKNPTQDIQKVAFTYRTLPNQKGKKADVELYGLKTSSDPNNAYRSDRMGQEADSVDAEVDSTGNYLRRETDSLREDVNEAREGIRKDANEVKENIDSTADKAGDKISKTAAQGAAEISDQRYEAKVGPNGETIYIDRDTKYYYLDKSGKKVYVTKMQLKDKID
jgi:hypothetical protein